ncbi:hypothetical protein M595_2591 [Lyngbya aestuarii BL J]|uniref:Uncharacterized protein n=1 Tax=Lyngbya aestuarii BL J TaxID=1348334 RepID=U7QJT3_9CYAN|nr:hypothetical protein M595_2591 [Lyngbya aestuarii BL J]
MECDCFPKKGCKKGTTGNNGGAGLVFPASHFKLGVKFSPSNH